MSSTGTQRGPYAKTAAVRKRILEASMEIFAEVGYRSMTMKQVAERAEISQRGLVHHFASKEDLLAAVLARHDEEVALFVPEATGAFSLSGLLGIVAETAERPGIVELYTTLAAEAVNPEHPANEHYRTRYRSFRRYVTIAFESLAMEGRLRPGVRPELLATAFISLLEGVQLQWLYDRAGTDIRATVQVFVDSVIIEPEFSN